MSTQLSAIAATVSATTLSAINNFLDVTGYVYGVVNLVTPAVNLEGQYAEDQNNYDEFRTNLSVYKAQAGLWIQPTKTQPNDIVSQITAMPEVITGISSTVLSDLNTIKSLGFGSKANKTFVSQVKTMISAAQSQVNGLIDQVATFKSDVDHGNAMLTSAYNGILKNVDADLQAEIDTLQKDINSLKAKVKSAQKEITEKDIEKGFAIGAIVIGGLTAWTGVGDILLGAGIAGVVLTEEEISALKDTIKTDKIKINNDFNNMSTDKAAKTAVVLFQQQVNESLEQHDQAMTELSNFSGLLGTLHNDVDSAYDELLSSTSAKDQQTWETDLDDAITAWNSTNNMATTLAKIQVKATPPATN